MYKSLRYIRIAVSLIALAVPTWALLTGYESVFVRMQILTSLMTGVWLVLIFWALVTLIYGRLYCSTVCPLGTLIDCVSTGARAVAPRGKHAKNFRYCSPTPTIQFIALLCFLVAVLSGSAFLPTLLDPYTAYARMVEELVARPLGVPLDAMAYTISAMAAAIATATGVVMVAWRRGRLICNTVCPIGTVMGMGSRKAYFHMEIDPDGCINCGECERVCKAQCIKLPEKTIDTARCVVCFDCAAACPTKALTYKSGRYRLDMPMMEAVGDGKANITSPDK
ncbi:MAG: 4Fe-4S binding protein [Muribaculaceae bacterium]|nr:4Fe-4S binding protein [Muribaculaceae bacterium]